MKKNIKIFYFENSALKIIEEFKFGSDLIINDISKITSLKTKQIKKFLIATEKITFKMKLIEKGVLRGNIIQKNKKKINLRYC